MNNSVYLRGKEEERRGALSHGCCQNPQTGQKISTEAKTIHSPCINNNYMRIYICEAKEAHVMITLKKSCDGSNIIINEPLQTALLS